MSIIGAISLGAGLLGGAAGAIGSRKAAERERELLQKRRAANDAWYARNYYGDYLNTAEASNAINRMKETLRERSQAARAREAVTGATPEMAVAQESESNKSMAELMGGLAARGDAYRRDVDTRKMQMDAATDATEAAMRSAQQGANAQLTSAGLNAIKSGLSQFDFGGLSKSDVPAEKKKEDKV